MKKLIIFGYTMDMGGAEKALLDNLPFLADVCEIDLYLLEKKGALLDKIDKRINVYQIKTNLFAYLLFRFVPFFRRRKINKIVSKKNYQYAFGYMEGRCGTWVADIKKKLKKYAWIHNDVNKFDIGISSKEIKNTYNKLDKVICVSNDSKIAFCNKYNIDSAKVEVIYNYINENEILEKADAFPVSNEVFTFVNVAKMRDQKRQDRLVYAAEYLKNKNYKFQIQLIGDGPNYEKINNLIQKLGVEDCVKTLGLQLNPYPYIKNCNAFVLCSNMEGYGIVIKEALLLKRIIITTDVVGPREILANGKYGIIVENDDDAIKYAMEQVLLNITQYNYVLDNISGYVGDNELIKNQTLELLN